MARLSDLKKRLGESVEAADAITSLTEFATIVVAGTTVSGGTLTLPLIFTHSGKATSALLRLAKLLINGDAGANEMHPADRVDEIFYVFAQHAYLTALSSVAQQPKGKVDARKHAEMAAALERSVIRPELAEASFEFGWTPEDGPVQLFDSYRAWIAALLKSAGRSEKDSDQLLKRVEASARRNLHRELVKKGPERQWMVNYQLLETTGNILSLLSHFRPVPAQNDFAWTRYLEALAAKPSLPIWGEEKQGLGIDQLFVEPSYTYTRHRVAGCVSGNPGDKVPLKMFLTGLLSDRRPSTELVFVMGGPGTGKTSLMEVLCGELAATTAIPVVLVPAKRLNPNRPILTEVQSYLRANGHGTIADLVTSTDDCILAIDGFDELAHATLSSLESFFRDAQDLVRERSSTRLRIVLSGRPTLFSANDVSIPSGSHVVALESFDHPRVVEWSRRWRTATGGTFEGSQYLESRSEDLQTLATQPMLLYLLAKMHEEGEPIDVDSTDVSGGRYGVYQHILDWVCRRQEEKRIPTALSIRLRRFLQVAGLATHQSGQRTLHWVSFGRALAQAGLVDEAEDIDAKIHSTILSFAFTNLEQRAWEFTHKSFGEALAAEGIGRVLEDISEIGRDGEPWRMPLSHAAAVWLDTLGPHFLTKDILDFCSGWAQQKDCEFISRLVNRLGEILSQLVGHSTADVVARIAAERHRPLHIVLGNAVRSWFALANAYLEILVSRDGQDAIARFAGKIELDQFRTGVLLSHFVAPISFGEASELFRLTSGMIRERRQGPSPVSLRQLVGLLQYLSQLEPQLVAEIGRNSRIGRHINVDGLREGSRLEPSVLSLAFRSSRNTIFVNGGYFRPSFEEAPIETVLGDLESLFPYGYEPNPLSGLADRFSITGGIGLGTAEMRDLVEGLIRRIEQAMVRSWGEASPK